MDLDTLIRSLDLTAHPEGGFYRETFRSPTRVTGYDGSSRSAVTQILYALPAGRSSAWHRVRSDEIWQHQGGAPLELFVIDQDGELTKTTLGDVRAGLTAQAVVPAMAWQAARVPTDEVGTWALCGCTVAPGFEFEDFEIADAPAVDALVHRLDDVDQTALVRELGLRT